MRGYPSLFTTVLLLAAVTYYVRPRTGARVPEPRHRERPDHIAKQSGNVFRVGIFLDFAGSSTRTGGPHGAYVQMSGRNRIDPHGGGIERLVTDVAVGLSRVMTHCGHLLANRSGKCFRVGIFP